MVLFTKVVLWTFKSPNRILSLTIQIKAIEKYLSVVQFIMLYKGFLLLSLRMKR